MTEGRIIKVSGPLVVAQGMREASLFDVVRVGESRLIGEIIEMHGDNASIQVYEETAGLGRGDKVVSCDEPLSVELGPGLLGGIFDGIERPLEKMVMLYGSNIGKGIDTFSLDREIKYHFIPCVEKGTAVEGGDVLGYVDEGRAIKHKIMLPPNMSGSVESIKEGFYTVTEAIGRIKTQNGKLQPLTLMQKWPVRVPRPYKKKLPPSEPMITGQRSIDALFPIAMGGAACVPGPFGSGKTVVQHQLAKWSNVDIVVYIGCGERGNEMRDVLNEFPEIKDPKTGQSLMERTVLIANTSDMPVAAREASIYTGITIAEYYRDMGYRVAVIADSTSRWAEALREMSGRLQEMPGEEGYPAYLTSRLAQFYERAGTVQCLGKEQRTGSLCAIGAVSPQGGDISEPVTQATLRIVKVFWGLDSSLAYRRHFPAINWLNSYSLYKDRLEGWYRENISTEWSALVKRAISTLQSEAELEEMVKLVGIDAISSSDRLTLEVARSIREDFLQQNAFDKDDSYTPIKQQYALLSLIFTFGDKSLEALSEGLEIDAVADMKVREKIARAKSVPDTDFEKVYKEIEAEIENELQELKRHKEDRK